MEQTRNLDCSPERLSPPRGQYFFGYYDVAAWSDDERFHLCHKVDFCDRLPGPEDVAVLGTIRVSDGEFTPFAETTAWNFQQGSLLQWMPNSAGREVIFNRRSGGTFVGVIRNLETGSERVLERAVAAVSPDGRRALSINFARLFDFRPGYGYAGVPDPFASHLHPADDGVFVTDLSDGSSRLIVSFADVHRMFPEQTQGKLLLINHVTFNTQGNRFLFLVRNNPGGRGGGWSTLMLTADLNGENVWRLHDWGMVSHYHWRDRDRVICYCSPGGAHGLYVLTDRTRETELVDGDFFRADGHCSYSPDRRRLLYDSYPSEEGYRSLYVYDLESRRGRLLGEFRSPSPAIIDIRADLHPRWSPSGRRISFDSIHEGFRGLYVVDAPPGSHGSGRQP